MAVSVRINFPGRIDMSGISADQIKKVMARSINKAIVGVKTDAVREITARLNINSALIRTMLSAQKTNTSELTGQLMASAFTIPMKFFKPVFVQGSATTRWVGPRNSGSLATGQARGNRKQGVTVTVIKGQSKTIRSAFLAVTKSGNYGVRAYGKYGTNFNFSEESGVQSSRLMTVSPLSTLLNKDVSKRLQSKASERYEKEFTRLVVDMTRGASY